MFLTFHNWSRIYHRRDGSTFFEVLLGTRFQHFGTFWRVQYAVGAVMESSKCERVSTHFICGIVGKTRFRLYHFCRVHGLNLMTSKADNDYQPWSHKYRGHEQTKSNITQNTRWLWLVEEGSGGTFASVMTAKTPCNLPTGSVCESGTQQFKCGQCPFRFQSRAQCFWPSTTEEGSITAEMAAPFLKFCFETDCTILQGEKCSNTDSDAMSCVMPWRWGQSLQGLSGLDTNFMSRSEQDLESFIHSHLPCENKFPLLPFSRLFTCSPWHHGRNFWCPWVILPHAP